MPPIKCVVENIRGVKKLEFEVKKITALQGRNGAAKSSSAYGAGLLASRSNPIDKRNDIREGATSGTVKLSTGKETSELWISRDGEPSLTGQAVYSSPVAVGLDSLVYHKRPEDRFRLLATTLQAVPTYKEFETELRKDPLFNKDLHCSKCSKPISDEPEHRKECKKEEGDKEAPYLIPVHIRNAWTVICPPETNEVDFERANKIYEKDRTALSGKWCGITGAKRWGCKVGVDWAPVGFTRKELLQSTVKGIEKEIADAKKALEKLVGDVAIASSEQSKLKERAGTVKRLEVEVQTLEACEKRLEAEVSANKPAVIHRDVNCFHCKQAQDIIDGISYPVGSEVVRDDDKFQKLEAELLDTRTQTRMARLALTSAQNAAKEIKSNKKEKTVDLAEVEKARAVLKVAEDKLAARQTIIHADLQHTEIMRTEALIAITAADGLPAQKLRKRIDEFNEEIQNLCKKAEWPTIKVERDGLVTYENRPYCTISTSEQFRTRTTLQVAFALWDRSDMVIIDGVDILDADANGGRSGLLSMLYDAQIRTVITCTLSYPSQMFDMEGSGYGNGYWVQDGEIVPADQLQALQERLEKEDEDFLEEIADAKGPEKKQELPGVYKDADVEASVPEYVKEDLKKKQLTT